MLQQVPCHSVPRPDPSLHIRKCRFQYHPTTWFFVVAGATEHWESRIFKAVLCMALVPAHTHSPQHAGLTDHPWRSAEMPATEQRHQLASTLPRSLPDGCKQVSNESRVERLQAPGFFSLDCRKSQRAPAASATLPDRGNRGEVLVQTGRSSRIPVSTVAFQPCLVRADDSSSLMAGFEGENERASCAEGGSDNEFVLAPPSHADLAKGNAWALPVRYCSTLALSDAVNELGGISESRQRPDTQKRPLPPVLLSSKLHGWATARVMYLTDLMRPSNTLLVAHTAPTDGAMFLQFQLLRRHEKQSDVSGFQPSSCKHSRRREVNRGQSHDADSKELRAFQDLTTTVSKWMPVPSNMSHVLEAATCHGRDLEAPDPQPFSVEYGGVLLDSRKKASRRFRLQAGALGADLCQIAVPVGREMSRRAMFACTSQGTAAAAPGGVWAHTRSSKIPASGIYVF
ncbi:unnamed protein product [Symbiodinium microadriaticum]|nr:unnamed protein product [Symbiodinium microadriaticum]CAE7948082.1 unnamed protein product [Symbiodinium sp. KB8]